MRADWERVQSLFLAASELEPEARRRFLDRECSGDAELQHEVESLLAHDGTGEHVITRALAETAQAVLARTHLDPGSRLGDYEVEALIGSGGMGDVYRAHDTRLARNVAIKVLAPYSSGEDRARRFTQEAQAAASLNHPNIVSVYQFGEVEGKPFLVTELLDGETLRNTLRRSPLPPRTAIEYAIQIARGMAAAHERGIVHRDLKPENIFVTRSGAVKILDFGLAKPVPLPSRSTGEGTATQPGLVVGTIGYMSPEQVRGEPTDHRSDLFAIGAVLYEMLAGRAAFKKDTSADTITAILTEQPPPLSQTGTLPNSLQRIVERCLEKNPERRFQSASDLAFALEALSGSAAIPAQQAGRRSRRRLLWAAVALIAVAAGAAWWAMPAASPRVVAVRQLTDDGEPKAVSMDAASGSLASDGSRVYYNDRHNGVWRIAQVAAAGGSSSPISTSIPNPVLAGINTDFTHLLTLHGWLLPLPTGVPRPVGDLANLQPESLTYFPDGHRIAFSKAGAIFVTDETGAPPKQVFHGAGEIRWLSVAPDGRRVRFTLLTDDWEGILEISLDGAPAHEVLKGWTGADYACCGQWTKDGRHFVFLGYHRGSFDIWSLRERSSWFDRASESPAQLTNGPLSYFQPGPALDDRTIFAIGAKRKGELVRYDPARREFVPYLGGISAVDVAASKDGRWVAYTSYPDNVLWRSHADGSDRLQLCVIKSFYPQFSPDGKRVAFIGYEPGSGLGAYLVDVAGGAPRRVLEKAITVTWSPDGTKLVYQEHAPHVSSGNELHILDLESHTDQELPESRAMYQPRWISDDSILAARDGEILEYSVNRQHWTPLVSNTDDFIVSPDGKYGFFDRVKQGGLGVYRISIADQEIQEVADLTNLKRVEAFGSGTWLGVTHDGDLLVTRDIGTEEIYALDVKW